MPQSNLPRMSTGNLVYREQTTRRSQRSAPVKFDRHNGKNPFCAAQQKRKQFPGFAGRRKARCQNVNGSFPSNFNGLSCLETFAQLAGVPVRGRGFARQKGGSFRPVKNSHSAVITSEHEGQQCCASRVRTRLALMASAAGGRAAPPWA